MNNNLNLNSNVGIVQAAVEQQQPHIVEQQSQMQQTQSFGSSMTVVTTTSTAQPTVQSLQHEIKDVGGVFKKKGCGFNFIRIGKTIDE